MSERRQDGISRRAGWQCLAGAFAAAALLLVPSSAIAKNEFETAFKHELGRIAAHEAVFAGRYILGVIVSGDPHHVHGAHGCNGHVPYAPYGYDSYLSYGHGHYKHHGHGHQKHHGRHHGH